MPNNTSYTAGSSGYGTVTGTGSSSNVTIDMGYMNKPDLPELMIESMDENGRLVKMVLSPESSISPPEVTKLLMLVTTIMLQGVGGFSVYAYVKKNNLERHFKYS